MEKTGEGGRSVQRHMKAAVCDRRRWLTWGVGAETSSTGTSCESRP
jgi:hypothetical protein